MLHSDAHYMMRVRMLVLALHIIFRFSAKARSWALGLENSWDKGRNRRRLVEEALTNVNIRSSPRHQKQSTDARVFRYVFYLLHLHRHLKSRSALIKLFLVCLCVSSQQIYLFHNQNASQVAQVTLTSAYATCAPA